MQRAAGPSRGGLEWRDGMNLLSCMLDKHACLHSDWAGHIEGCGVESGKRTLHQRMSVRRGQHKDIRTGTGSETGDRTGDFAFSTGRGLDDKLLQHCLNLFLANVNVLHVPAALVLRK